MSMNYNITVLKTLKDSMAKAFQDVLLELAAVKDGAKKPEQLVIREMINIAGGLHMVGRPSLIRLAKEIRFALERIQAAESFGWDAVRVSAVATLSSRLITELADHVSALERSERELAVRMWPSWSNLEIMLDRPSPPTSALFDPDPVVPSEDFAALAPEALRELARPHIEKLSALTSTMAAIDPKADLQAWHAALHDAAEVFDWAYALRHRMGYHAYWLACRARMAAEQLMVEPTEKTEMLELISSILTELNKFAEDSRKPRPDMLQKVLSFAMDRWSLEWPVRQPVLSELEMVFGMEDFWRAQDEVRDAANQKSENAFVAKSEELLQSLHAVKSAWSKLSADGGGDSRPFLRALIPFLPKYEMFPNPGVRPLMEALKAVAQNFISAQPNEISTEFAQEVAVTLLLIEETIERKGRWSPELAAQADLAKRRTLAASSNRLEELAHLPPVLWGPDKKRQQSQDAVAKVITEVQADLAFIEDVCDEFFRRDAIEARSQYEEVKRKAFIVNSVLLALGQSEAASVMGVVSSNLSVLDGPGQPADYGQQYEQLSIAMAGLTTFLSAFEKGDANATDMLHKAIARLDMASVVPVARPGTQQIQSAPLAAVQPPVAIPAQSVNADQQHMDDAQAAATRAFDEATLWTDTTEDRELAECFFDEAANVLTAIERLLSELARTPEDPELLAALRRQFHTIKGSGRTALLWGVGETARRAEAALNEHIARSTPINDDTVNICVLAADIIRSASHALDTQGRFDFQPSEILLVAPHATAASEPAIAAVLDQGVDAAPVQDDVAPADTFGAQNDDAALDAPATFADDIAAPVDVDQPVEALVADIAVIDLDQSAPAASAYQKDQREPDRIAEILARITPQDKPAARPQSQSLQVNTESEDEQAEAQRIDAEYLLAEATDLRLDEDRAAEDLHIIAGTTGPARTALLDDIIASTADQDGAAVTFEPSIEYAYNAATVANPVEADRHAAEEADRLAAEQAEADRIAAEQAEAERLAAEQAEADRIAAEQAEADRLAAEQAQAERIAAEQAEADRLAAEQAEADRLAAEQAEAERIAAEQAEADRLAAEQAQAERLAAEQAEADRIAAEQAEADRLAAKQAEIDRQVAEAARQEQLLADQLAADQAEAERLEAEHRRAAQAEVDRMAAERALAQSHAADKAAENAAREEREAAEKAEDRAMVLKDLNTHRKNLLEIMSTPSVDIDLLHISAHTLSSLGRTLGLSRFAAFSKTLERSVEACMTAEEKLVASTDDEAALRKFIVVLMEKTDQIIGNPDQEPQWDGFDAAAEESLASFVLSEPSTQEVIAAPTPPPNDDAEQQLWAQVNSHFEAIAGHVAALQAAFAELAKKD